MPASRHFFRIDTTALKVGSERKLGHQKAEKYFKLLRRYWSLQITKTEFDKMCFDLVGRQNIFILNELIRGIVKNAIFSDTPPKPSKPNGSLTAKVPNGFQRSSLMSICRDVFPWSPKKGRTPNLRECKFKDRPSPLGPHGKTNNVAFEVFFVLKVISWRILRRSEFVVGKRLMTPSASGFTDRRRRGACAPQVA